MLNLRFVLWMFSAVLMVLGSGTVSGQDFPSKPIRILTSPPGSANDFTARLVAQGISGALGQPVIIDNRVSLLATEVVAKAPPDGYTLLVQPDAMWIGPFMRPTSYDAVKDFAPISLVTAEPNILVVHPSLPVKSVKELIALAKARPGALNYSSGSIGGGAHLSAELFRAMTGVKFVLIYYKNSAVGISDLVAGLVDFRFAGTAGVMPHIKSGRLRAVAITTARPSALFPGLPTVAATVPGYEAGSVTGVPAPAKTPVAIINRLSQEIVRGLNTGDVKEKLLAAAQDIVASSPEEFAARIKSDMAVWGKLITELGIKAD